MEPRSPGAPVRVIAARPAARPPLQAREGFAMGEANEAHHQLMALGKTQRSFC